MALDGVELVGVGLDGVGFDGVGLDGVGFDGVGLDGVGLDGGALIAGGGSGQGSQHATAPCAISRPAAILVWIALLPAALIGQSLLW